MGPLEKNRPALQPECACPLVGGEVRQGLVRAVAAWSGHTQRESASAPVGTAWCHGGDPSGRRMHRAVGDVAAGRGRRAGDLIGDGDGDDDRAAG